MLRLLLPLAVAGLAAAPSAHAYPIHQVQPGETLTAIAAANGMSPVRLAAANGIPWNSYVRIGQVVQIPPQGTAPVAPAAPAAPAASPAAPSAAPAAAPAPAAGGSTVRPGDTLSAISLRVGIPIAQLVAANGLSSPNLILAGTTLRLPGAAAAPAMTPVTAVTSSSTGPEGTPAATGSGAVPTSERLSGAQISQIAAQHGVPGDLAAAVAWQESGFNNALTSSAGARGIMQVMPGTWDWINSTLARPPLQRASATDNVRAGSLFLRQLLQQTGGDAATAVAGYYQGLGSVRRNGMLPETRRYVSNVLSLRGRTG